MYTRGLLAAVLITMVLVVACTNLGTLLLARGVMREREIAIRLALGAGRRRIVRQLFTESLLLAALGCAGALILSSFAVGILQARLGDIGVSTVPDWRVLAATLAIGLVAALTFGLAPALRLTGAAPRGGRARTVFVAIQVAAGCLLLMLSGVLVRSYQKLAAADVGFDFRKMATVEPHLGDHGYRGPAALTYLRDLRARLLEMPGVEQASLVWLPLWGKITSETVAKGQRVSINRVDTDFLSTVGLRLVRGRNFEPGEQNGAIVSDALARWLWPDQDPIGKPLSFDNSTVIGVVRQADTFRLHSETLGVYYPLTMKEAASASLVVRVAAGPRAYLGRFTGAAKAMDGRLLPRARALDQEYEEAFAAGVNLLEVIAGLGTLATLIAAIGLAGLTGYTVGQRTLEIGVRMALGAGAAQVLRGVFAPMFRPVVIGFGFGMLGGAGMAATLQRELYGVSPLDPAAYLAALALFTLVILLATAAPARRATRVNPAEALRHE
jgi:predicted permease